MRIIPDLFHLEDKLGDPWLSENPIGFDAMVKADEFSCLPPEGQKILDSFALNAEFVPTSLGGRLSNLNRLIAILRSVFRRAPGLGLGYGASSFLAAVNVWTSGDIGQQQKLATALLANRKVACCFHELAHGNDIGRAQCLAEDEGDSFVINGKKEVVANISLSDLLLVYARTSEKAGPRSHSLYLVDRPTTSHASVRDLPRFHSSGMRGVRLGGIEFNNCKVDRSCQIGTTGGGLETALKAFQLSRIALPGMFSGVVDTGLRLTLRHLRHRKLYGRVAADIPLVRSKLAEVFADLLLCDCFCTVSANASHQVPSELSLYAASVKSLIPAVLTNSMNNLATILGGYSYLREGESAIFQMLLRDLQPVSFGHASRMSCLMLILPQLPIAARRAWSIDQEVPTGLFRLKDDVGEISFAELSLAAGSHDSLAPALLRFLGTYSSCSREKEISTWIHILSQEFRSLRTHCSELHPSNVGLDAPAEAFYLAERYTILLAASSCIGVWCQQARDNDTFLSEPVWLLAVLHRLGVLLGYNNDPLPDDLREAMCEEITRRYENNSSFDLHAHKLARSDHWTYGVNS